METKTNNINRKKRVVEGIGCCVILILFIIWVVYAYFDNKRDEDIPRMNMSVFGTVYVCEHYETITLHNYEENSIHEAYLKYTISDTDGNVLWETDLLEPGEFFEINLCDYFSEGEYVLHFHVESIDMNTGEAGAFACSYNSNIIVNKDL